MSLNQSGWKPSAPIASPSNAATTTTGNRALMLEEPLIFEIGDSDTTGVDFGSLKPGASRLGGLAREDGIDLPGLTEPEAVRHYTRLSRQNYAIDLGLFPLGSCTMKHNPRLNEKMARLPGFADIHPLQPQETVQGALELINRLAFWLIELTGMHGVAMSPKAGAHGELCGILCIRAALEARGDVRSVVLVPESAHGTNPATAAFAGYKVEDIPATAACSDEPFLARSGRRDPLAAPAPARRAAPYAAAPRRNRRRSARRCRSRTARALPASRPGCP